MLQHNAEAHILWSINHLEPSLRSSRENTLMLVAMNNIQRHNHLEEIKF